MREKTVLLEIQKMYLPIRGGMPLSFFCAFYGGNNQVLTIIQFKFIMLVYLYTTIQGRR